MTYEQLIERCKELRSIHERARSEFFLFLMQVERDHVETWKAAGIQDFDQFIRSHDLCQPHLYRLFVEGCNREGAERALEYGASWTIEAGRAKQVSPGFSEEFSKRAEAFIEVNHVPPSAQTAERWRRDLDKPQTVRVVKHASELHRLRAENQMLRAENRTLKSENEKLKKQLEKQSKKAA